MSTKYLITGGAGFIGSNYADRLLYRGEEVTIYDNLSRAGAPLNLEWLQTRHGNNSFTLIQGDIENPGLLEESAKGKDVIVHLAGQVAVTKSVQQPRLDFESNALGTFNVLEAARKSNGKPILIYASTNKVYGGMEDLSIEEQATRYVYKDLPYGIPEIRSLDFHSPYGCSKGTGDQYMLDYHRIYGVQTIVFRQSCIYGPRQFGIEDQGWVAWFLIAAEMGIPLTIYGNGKQVRDVLHVADLMDAYDAGIGMIDRVSGQAFNIGGGPENTISIWREFGPLMEEIMSKRLPVSFEDWRPGDQRVYISDIRKAYLQLGWSPKIPVKDGIRNLYEWIHQNRSLFNNNFSS